MNTRKMQLASLVLAIGLSGSAQAALQGRDLNGSVGSFEAYYDTVLDITWLADADYAHTSGYVVAGGAMTWVAANAWAAQLSFTDGVNVYDNWRLPTVNPVNGSSFNYNYSANGSTDVGYNISEQGTAYADSTANEMAHMYYNTLNNPGYTTIAGAVSGCYGDFGNINCLDNVGPFSNLLIYGYWTATGYAPDTSEAWIFATVDGGSFGINKNVSCDSRGGCLAWAVSSGDVAITGVPVAVPEADTWAMLLAGLTLVGAAARRRK